jgi:hypothetical protein
VSCVGDTAARRREGLTCPETDLGQGSVVEGQAKMRPTRLKEGEAEEQAKAHRKAESHKWKQTQHTEGGGIYRHHAQA